MGIRTYLEIIWRRFVVVCTTLLVTYGIVAAGTYTATPVYEASATLRVLTVPRGSSDYVSYDVAYTDRLMNTYAELATSGPVLDELLRRMGGGEVPSISLEIVPNSELMRIVVEDADPRRASLSANTLAAILVENNAAMYAGGGRTAQSILGEQLAQMDAEITSAQRQYEELVVQSPENAGDIAALGRSIEVKREIYAMLLQQYERARLNETLRASALSIADPASVPTRPSKPRVVVNIVLGAVVGLLGGVGLALVFDRLDARLYTAEQIEQVTSLPQLSRVPRGWRLRSLASFNGASPQMEAYRYLRTNLDAISRHHQLRTLMVTSAEPREGKSTTVANLAIAVARTGRRVAVVDADLRRPTLDELFGVANHAGLTDALKREASLDRLLQASPHAGISVLPSGPIPPNPAEMLTSDRMRAVLQELAHRFDLVLVDTPCLGPVTDPAVVASLVDGVLVVVGCARSTRDALVAALQQLGGVNANVLGVVVNLAEPNYVQRYNRYYRSE